MGRKILSVVLGLIASGIVVFAIENVGHYLYPPPDGISMENKEVIENYINNAPFLSLIIVVFAWLIGSFTGSIVTKLISKSNQTVKIYGMIFIIFTSVNLFMIPHPTWMWAALITIYPVVLIGSSLIKSGENTNE